MSRAFVKENDDWYFCTRAMDSCMFADENGRCLASSCKNVAYMAKINAEIEDEKAADACKS